MTCPKSLKVVFTACCDTPVALKPTVLCVKERPPSHTTSMKQRLRVFQNAATASNKNYVIVLVSHQLFVQHPKLEVGEKICWRKVECLLVTCERHLVLPLALVGASQATENFATGGIQLRQLGRGA